MYIEKHLRWKNDEVFLNGKKIANLNGLSALDATEYLYKQIPTVYPKFFKMDLLSRVAFVASELFSLLPHKLQQEKIAVVLSTSSGCIEVDKKFEESRQEFASPALFVYTLPNIMLGEICIRNGFKGEQTCTISPEIQSEWLMWHVQDLIVNRDTQACLCGHVEATSKLIDVSMMWVLENSNQPDSLPFDLLHINNLTV